MEKTEINELVAFILSSGNEILKKQGAIEDIGVKKQYLTEEDIRIEKGLKSIIDGLSGDHQFYSEEENDTFVASSSVWIVDPISGTKLFIEGRPHYAIVLAHMSEGIVDLAIVYDPSDDSLYQSDGSGAYLNGNRILMQNGGGRNKIVFAPSYGWADTGKRDELKRLLERDYEVFPSQGSMALNYCLVARGEFDGVVSLTKDAFTEFAGLFIANQSGAIATNIDRETTVHPSDRVFVCASNRMIYEELMDKTRLVVCD